MTDRPPLNPPETPQCQEYLKMENTWRIWVMLGDKRANELKSHLILHRASCPLCQARMAENNELARNAREPEDTNEP
jgi:hypothetical protein